MPPDFSKWWNCLKKHTKRSQSWLRRARDLSNEIASERPFRYFTLCARPMIDVFMLAKEGILDHDESFGNLADVVFCEYNQEYFPEITEMIGIEGSGFLGELERFVLFEDDGYSSEFPTLRSIQLELENQDLEPEHQDILMLKRQHLEFANKFPFDFLNLDFCGYYYPKPPGILQINRTVDRMLELQNRESQDQDGRRISINEFVLAVTCKFDANVPEEAFRRLQRIVTENRDNHEAYSQALLDSRGTLHAEEWQQADNYDFFLGSWPKELLRIARDHGLTMQILDYMHYERTGDEGNIYHIVSLSCGFKRNGAVASYLAESIRVLNPGSRIFIDEVDRTSAVGKTLLADLEEIVAIRNARARVVGRLELGAP